jgi:sugar transferase EpsL
MIMYRWLEFSIALISLILLSPLLLFAAVLILISMGRPILFKQQRPGLNAKPFIMYKFRTMGNGSDSDIMRLTKLGKFLRSLSIDELPQLYNVLIGDLSLVGPRPLLMEYLPLYSPEQARRHLVKPGITGWAQVNGRNAIDWDAKFSLDVWYVDNKSLLLDLKILFLTMLKVVQAKGIGYKDQAIMPKFTGANIG